MFSSMQSMNTILRIYYSVKPFIPRHIQLWLRRNIVRRSQSQNAWRWPILESAGRQPMDWPGWPDRKKFALVLTHDVEHMLGVSRCEDVAELERDLGFCSSFNFVPERYNVPSELRRWLTNHGFEIGVHGLKHDGKLYESKATFFARAEKINQYITEWGAVGFRSPAMHHNLEWIGHLNIEYDLSTFDTDPFEPQSDGMETIFPFLVERTHKLGAYVEMPYTLPQDHMLYIIMQEQTIDIWKRKVDWIVEHGGMVLVNIHPDYISFDAACGPEEYSADIYSELLMYIATKYSGQYWNALPCHVAEYYRSQALEPVKHRYSIELINEAEQNQTTAPSGSKSKEMATLV